MTGPRGHTARAARGGLARALLWAALLAPVAGVPPLSAGAFEPNPRATGNGVPDSVREPGEKSVQPPQPRFEDRVEVTEVLLDVVVTDRRGNPVAGLGPDDFQVLEDGREVKLTGAEFYSTRYDPRSAAGTLPVGGAGGEAGGALPASRYFILFFHDVRSMSNRFNRLAQQQSTAARQIAAWIEEEMRPSDWIAVAGFGVRLKVFQDFTQDREALARALSAAARSRDPEKSRWTRRPAAAGAPSLLRELPPRDDPRRRRRNIHSALGTLAEAAGHVAGRKMLLYFGIGFGELDGPGLSALPDRRYYPELEKALNDNNVAVYPLDLTVQGTRHAQSSFLNGLALDTGGVYYRNFVSFANTLRSIAGENVSYYLLSYRAEHPAGKRGYQRIRVRARADGLLVRAQRGYRYGPQTPG